MKHDKEGPVASHPKSLKVTSELSIPRSELVLRASRSSGAGGQHVNKTSSRIELTWNVLQSPSLSGAQRDVLLSRLRSRITADGDLRIVASTTRSQLRNRGIAEDRLVNMLENSLQPVKKRKPTRPGRAAKEARLSEKKKHASKKRERREPVDE